MNRRRVDDVWWCLPISRTDFTVATLTMSPETQRDDRAGDRYLQRVLDLPRTPEDGPSLT